MTKKMSNHNQRFREKEAEYWATFSQKLTDLDSVEAAQLFAASAPGSDLPGRKFHTNLLYFLETFGIPGDASKDEMVLYLNFLMKLDPSNVRLADKLPSAIEQLQRSIKSSL
jgi:hypothetical protein